MRQVTRGLLALATAAAASAMPVTIADTAGAAPTRCAGRAATIVSDARKVAGTPGSDVIVVRSRWADVDAGAGDDKVCVRGRRGFTVVQSGPGDDEVKVESTTFTAALLRDGRDTFRGGPGPDFVVSGVRGSVNRDQIDLAEGDDSAALTPGADHRGAEMLGGEGHDEISLMVRGGTLRVDAAAALATHRGATYARWTSFERHAVFSGGAQVFSGSEGDDHVSFEGRGSATAMTLGGDDTVQLGVVTGDVDTAPFPFRARVWARARAGTTARVGRVPVDRISLDLGPGRDELGVSSPDEEVRADLVQARIELFSAGVATGSFGFTGVEDLSVTTPDASRRSPTRVALLGDDHDNRLQANACHVELRGGAGDDRLRVGLPLSGGLVFATDASRDRCPRTSTVEGGTGDDVLVSRVLEFDFHGVEDGEMVRPSEVPVHDLLDGGEGLDTADAGKGTDTCIAEVHVDCEA